MTNKEFRNTIDAFYKDKGFKKIKSPGFVFTKLDNEIRTYQIIITKSIPNRSNHSIHHYSTEVIFERLAEIPAKVFNLEGIKVGREMVYRGFSVDEDIYTNIINGGGHHNIEYKLKQYRTFENATADELCKYLDDYHAKRTDFLNELGSLTHFYEIVENLWFDHWEMQTFRGSFHIWKLVLRKLFNHPEYDEYSKFVKNLLINSKDTFIEMDDEEGYYKLISQVESFINYLEKIEPLENID